MSGRGTVIALGAGILLVAGAAYAGDDEEKMPEQGVVHLFVSDPKGESLGGDKATVTVYLDYGGFKKTAKAEVVHPKTAAHEEKDKDEVHHGIETHGGQVVTSDDYTVEMLVTAGEETPEEHAKMDEPHFEVKVSLVTYQDSMKDAPPAEKAGKCAKCGMAMQAHPAEFTAVVVVKVGDKTVNAKGFKYPEEMPKSLAEAAKKIEGQLAAIDALVAGKKLDDVHKVAEGISKVAEHLGDIAPAADKAAVTKLGKEIVELFESIDKAADAGKADETKAVVAQYREKLAALKKLVK